MNRAQPTGPIVKRHPLTDAAIRPLWIRPDGRACWPIMGGAPDDPPAGDPPAGDPPAGDPPAGDPPADPPDPDADKLGEAGRRALDRERAARQAANERARKAEAELQELRDAAKPAEQRDLEKARREGHTEGLKVGNARLVRAEAKAAAAAAKFRDPADVIAQLGSKLDGVEVSEDGEIDEAAVRTLVEDLAKDKPYLLATTGTAPASDAGIGAGNGGGNGTPANVTPGLGRMAHAYATTSTTKTKT